jgi:hypothetical protein
MATDLSADTIERLTRERDEALAALKEARAAATRAELQMAGLSADECAQAKEQLRLMTWQRDALQALLVDCGVHLRQELGCPDWAAHSALLARLDAA